MLTTRLPVAPKLKIKGATPLLTLYGTTALVGTNLAFKFKLLAPELFFF
jgi:hypothetical protein